MRNRILKGSLLLALGYLPVLGCGGGKEDDGGGGLKGKGGSGGSAAGIGNGGTSSGTAGTIIFGGTTGNGGSTGKGGASGSVGDDACVEGSVNGAKATVALYFMVDISGSMNCHIPEADPPCTTDPRDTFPTTRWTEAGPALQSFFSSSGSNGMWAGINFFSQNNSCNARDYMDPAVEIAALPGNATAINNAIMNQDPAGYTPTVPSITAAIDHARDWAEAHDDQQVVVVYMTDGYPLGCDGGNNTIANAASVAADGFSGSPSIRTFVLGIGPNLTDLNQIAMSGGTGQAIFINTGMDVNQQLLDALNAIREDVSVDCTYTIPTPANGQTIDPAKVNVRITTSAGTRDVGMDDPSDSSCNGWEYSNDMSQIVLCGDACDAIQNDPSPGLEVVFGCRVTGTEPP